MVQALVLTSILKKVVSSVSENDAMEGGGSTGDVSENEGDNFFDT